MHFVGVILPFVNDVSFSVALPRYPPLTLRTAPRLTSSGRVACFLPNKTFAIMNSLSLSLSLSLSEFFLPSPLLCRLPFTLLISSLFPHAKGRFLMEESPSLDAPILFTITHLTLLSIALRKGASPWAHVICSLSFLSPVRRYRFPEYLVFLWSAFGRSPRSFAAVRVATNRRIPTLSTRLAFFLVIPRWM